MPPKRPREEHPNQLSMEEQQFQADLQWAQQDSNLRNTYAGKVIAVCDRQVIAAAKTITELQQRLDKLPKKDPRRSRWVVVSMGA